MKLQRFILLDDPQYSEIQANAYGDWCTSKDVAELESKCAELEAKCAELEAKFDDCAELVCSAKDVIARWGSPRWKWDEHTGDIINRLRQAVAKCEGLNHE